MDLFNNSNSFVIKYLLWLGIFIASINPCFSQVHIAPENGADGIPGVVPKSFTIEWAPVPGARAYEYVMSDNPLCFTGCPGDTRQWIVQTTTATEYNLQTDTWYYWITRVYFETGDTTEWTFISSFFATTPKSKGNFIELSPHPSMGENISFKIDWGINPDATEIKLDVYTTSGQLLRNWVFKKTSNGIRFEDVRVPRESLANGIYLIRFSVNDNLNNPNNSNTLKLILQ